MPEAPATATPPTRDEARAAFVERVRLGIATAAEYYAEGDRLRREGRRNRDKAIRAHVELRRELGIERWQRGAIVRFLSDLSIYKRGAWFADAHRGKAPADPATVHLWAAIKSGVEIPESIEGIRKLLPRMPTVSRSVGKSAMEPNPKRGQVCGKGEKSNGTETATPEAGARIERI